MEHKKPTSGKNAKTVMEFGNPGNNMHHLIEQGMYRAKVKAYSLKLQKLKKIYQCSFGKGESENISFPIEFKILYNKWNMPSLLFAFLMPFLFFKQLKESDVYNARQMSSSFYAIYCKIFVNRKIVVHCGYDWQEFAEHSCSKIYQLFVKLWCYITYKAADAFVVTSVRHKKRVEKYTKKSNAFLLRNAVDLDFFKSLNKPRRPFEFFFAGRLEEQKNIKNLIKAVTIARGKVSLKIAGRGSQEKELRDYAQSLNADAEFLGSVTPDELINNYYSCSAAFILPSFYEGHSNALTEAMACGMPVIAGDTEGNTEIIRDKVNGLICGHSAEEIAEVIDYFFEHPEQISKFVQNALDDVKKHYDLVKRTDKETDILLEYCRKG